MMRMMMRRLTAVAMVFAMLSAVIPVARAETRTPTELPGWENWAAEYYQFFKTDAPSIFLTCPKRDATPEEIYYYVGKLLSERYDTETDIWLFFPMPRWSQAEGDAWCLSQDGLLRWREWLYPESRIAVNCNFDDGKLQIRIRPASGFSSELAARVVGIGEAAKAASETVRGQLEYVNRYLCKMVEYDADFNSDNRYIAYGALVEGVAVCGGYTEAVTMLCDYLQIPNIRLSATGLDGAEHTWNAVFVDGEWMQLDVTWNDPGQIIGDISPEDEAEAFEAVSRLYFLVETIEDQYGYHKTSKDALAQQQAAIPVGWDGITAPYRSISIASDLVARGILRGDQNGELNLSTGLTRAELAVLLARMEGAEDDIMTNRDEYNALCGFTDVPDWAAPYVGYCVQKGLMKGYSDSTFGSSDAVTTAAACTVILRHMDYPETDWDYNSAVSKATSIGLVSPYWHTGHIALRVDMVQLICRAIAK